MCEFHGSNCNGLGDIWWTDKCIYFSSIEGQVFAVVHMAVLFHGTYGDHFSPLYVFGVEQASK